MIKVKYGSNIDHNHLEKYGIYRQTSTDKIKIKKQMIYQYLPLTETEEAFETILE